MVKARTQKRRAAMAQTIRSLKKSVRRIYRRRIKNSICIKKRSDKCRKTSGCKYARGRKRSYCRKSRNRKASLSLR